MNRYFSAALAVALVLTSSVSVSAAELTAFTTVANTDIKSFGIGYMRGPGSGDLSVSGLSGQINSAYLFWHGPTNTNDANANAIVSFGGTSVTGVNIGFSSDNNWDTTNSQAYRADVSSIVQTTGNGIYALSGFTKPRAFINGVSLIVFYNDSDGTNNKDVALFNGNDSNEPNRFDPNGWTSSLSGINYTAGSAFLTLHVSDGQVGNEDRLLINGVEFASGNSFGGTTAQTGHGTFPNNGSLWDVRSFDVTSLLSVGTSTLSLSSGLVNDRLSLIVASYELPAGSLVALPPPPPAVPEPASWAMMMLGFGLIGSAARRRFTSTRQAV